MRHTTLSGMYEALLENPEEILVSSNSKHCALYGTSDGNMWFLGGDFSGTKEECEAEARRIMNTTEDKDIAT